jgi:hypothetical protein
MPNSQTSSKQMQLLKDLNLSILTRLRSIRSKAQFQKNRKLKTLKNKQRRQKWQKRKKPKNQSPLLSVR